MPRTFPVERLPRPSLDARLDPRVCDRAIALLQKLRHVELSPYVLGSNSNNLVQAAFATMNVDDFKNQSGGPFILTRARFFTTAAVAASASGAVFSNISPKIIDNDQTRVLCKHPTLLPVLVDYADNSAYLDRPHVIAPVGSFSVILEEENINATTDVWVALLGEAVVPAVEKGVSMTASEVREAIGLGIYPAFSSQQAAWERREFYPMLLGDEPVCSPEIEEARWDLRARVAELRLLLSQARFQSYSFEGNADNIPQNATTSMAGERFRNDSGSPMAITRIRVFTAAAVVASAAVAVFNNVAFLFTHGGPNQTLTRTAILGPCLFTILDNEWVLERPLILGPDEGINVQVVEQSVNATTDVYIAMHGEIVRGMSTAELRECVSLGLYGTWERG